MNRPRAPLQPPFTHDEAPPGRPAGLRPSIFCRGRGEPVTIFLRPLSATANRPPPPGGVPIQLKRQWMMLLGLPEHIAADDALVERAINKFAALIRVDRSHAPMVDGVTRVFLEALVADVDEVPRVLGVSFDDGPVRREVDVDVVLFAGPLKVAGRTAPRAVEAA